MLQRNKMVKAWDMIIHKPKAVDFSQMEEDIKNEARYRIREIKQIREIGKWMSKTKELADFIGKSEDYNTRFFGSQLKLVSSGPETLREKLCDKENRSNFDEKYYKKFDKIIDKIDTEAIITPKTSNGDALRGFYLSAILYHELLSASDEPYIVPTSMEVISGLKEYGKAASEEPGVKPFYDFFSKFGNRQVHNNPALTFITTYLYRLFAESKDSKTMFKNINERKDFFKVFGQKMVEIGESFDRSNDYRSFYPLAELYMHFETGEKC